MCKSSELQSESTVAGKMVSVLTHCNYPCDFLSLEAFIDTCEVTVMFIIDHSVHG